MKTVNRLSGVWIYFRIRHAAFFVCVLCCLLLFCISASAAENNAWRFHYTWDDDTLYENGFIDGKIDSPSQESYLKPSYDDAFTQKLEEMELYPLLPYRLPDGYALTRVESHVPTEYLKWVFGAYDNNGKSLTISVHYIGAPRGAPTGLISKDERDPIIYERGGLTFYIVYNLKWLHAYWLDPPFKLFMGGEVSLEEIKMLIDSMFDRE
jgi:hypothetical protein